MANKNGHNQYAALPFKVVDGQLFVMLITSRETHRWVLPKGWPEKNLAGHEVAACEAFEEAGLLGQVATEAIASFDYMKQLDASRRRRCRVDVFPFRVEQELLDWPERSQRQRRWMNPKTAATLVTEAELGEILRGLSVSVVETVAAGGQGKA